MSRGRSRRPQRREIDGPTDPGGVEGAPLQECEQVLADDQRHALAAADEGVDKIVGEAFAAEEGADKLADFGGGEGARRELVGVDLAGEGQELDVLIRSQRSVAENEE